VSNRKLSIFGGDGMEEYLTFISSDFFTGYCLHKQKHSNFYFITTVNISFLLEDKSTS
jgi:hypothetical protein